MPAARTSPLDLSAFRYSPSVNGHPLPQRPKNKPLTPYIDEAAAISKLPRRDLAKCDIPYPLTAAERAAFRTPSGKRVSAHHWAVYDATRRIPAGRIATYKAVSTALRLGSPRSVGAALRDNPFAPFVPCHRVIASSLFVGGFLGEWKTLRGGEGAGVGVGGGEGEEVLVGRGWHESLKGKGPGVVQRGKMRMLALEGVPFSGEGKLLGGEEFLCSVDELIGSPSGNE